MPADPAAALIEADEALRVWRAVLRQMRVDAGGHDPKRREAVRRRLETPIEVRFNRRSWENARRARQRKREDQAAVACLAIDVDALLSPIDESRCAASS